MGILRLYLAVCVVAVHSGRIFPWSSHDGHQAVQIFFLISGFYMSMVYGTKYRSMRAFYASRFFRIYVPYGLVLMATIALSLLASAMKWNYVWPGMQIYLDAPLDHNGAVGVVVAAISNVTIFLQDWVMFLHDEKGGSFGFTSDFRTDASPLYRYLLVPQAWSIALELTFYLLVPLLTRLSTRTLILIAAASLLARLIAYRWLQLDRDPWEYRFFPFEVATFILGILSNRLYAALPYRRLRFQPVSPLQYLVSTPLLVGIFIGSAFAVEAAAEAVGHHNAVLLSYAVWALLLPALFHVFRKSAIDRFIGELSYPVYLTHLLIISPVGAIGARLGLPAAVQSPMGAVASIVFSAGLYYLVLMPLEARRSTFVARVDKSPAPEAMAGGANGKPDAGRA